MLVGTLAASLLEKMLADKGVIQAGEKVIQTGEGASGTSRRQATIRAG